jgi:hypothetical protein
MFDQGQWVDANGHVKHTETVTSSAPPKIDGMRHGFITHDYGRGNTAATHFHTNAYFIAPTSSTSDYDRTTAVFWGADRMEQLDGLHVKIHNSTGLD